MNGCLYRFHAADGTLLYVGATADIGSRVALHGVRAPLYADVAAITLQHFPTRTEALDAERTAVATEAPLWNTQLQMRPTKRGEGIGRRRGLLLDPVAFDQHRGGFPVALVAANAQVAPAMLCDLRRQRRGASKHTAQRLAAALGCDVADLFPAVVAA